MGDSSLSAAGKRPTELKLLSIFSSDLESEQSTLVQYVRHHRALQGIWAGTLRGWRVCRSPGMGVINKQRREQSRLKKKNIICIADRVHFPSFL